MQGRECGCRLEQGDHGMSGRECGRGARVADGLVRDAEERSVDEDTCDDDGVDGNLVWYTYLTAGIRRASRCLLRRRRDGRR